MFFVLFVRGVLFFLLAFSLRGERKKGVSAAAVASALFAAGGRLFRSGIGGVGAGRAIQRGFPRGALALGRCGADGVWLPPLVGLIGCSELTSGAYSGTWYLRTC